MSWLSFLRKTDAEVSPTPERLGVPLFPLGTVLMPDGLLSLKVFEQRYLDMAAACMRANSPFGVCLIESGKEVGEVAIPHRVGTLAHIESGDMPQLGILMLKLRGGRRFRIISHSAQASGLLTAQVELFAQAESTPLPAEHQGVLPLLRRVIAELGPEKVALPHHFGDASWVGYRLIEILPVQPLAKQKLLELDDPISRLEIIHTYLAQHHLVQ